MCWTILADYGVKLSGKPESAEILKETLKTLKLHHEDVDETKKTYESLKKTVNGLHTTLRGICELRNSHGLVGHGRDGYAPAMEGTQAQFVASAADAIVHILYMSHKGYGGNDTSLRVVYEDYEKENVRLDESFDVDSMVEFVKNFLPSEVLFKMDKVAYRAEIEKVRNEDAV